VFFGVLSFGFFFFFLLRDDSRVPFRLFRRPFLDLTPPRSLHRALTRSFLSGLEHRLVAFFGFSGFWSNLPFFRLSGGPRPRPLGTNLCLSTVPALTARAVERRVGRLPRRTAQLPTLPSFFSTCFVPLHSGTSRDPSPTPLPSY